MHVLKPCLWEYNCASSGWTLIWMPSAAVMAAMCNLCSFFIPFFFYSLIRPTSTQSKPFTSNSIFLSRTYVIPVKRDLHGHTSSQSSLIRLSWPQFMAVMSNSTFLTTAHVSHVKFDFFDYSACHIRISWPLHSSWKFSQSWSCFLYFSSTYKCTHIWWLLSYFKCTFLECRAGRYSLYVNLSSIT